MSEFNPILQGSLRFPAMDMPLLPDALCKNIDQPERFFPEVGQKDVARDIKNLCEICPERVPCAKYAIKSEIRHGIWGGLSFRERKAIASGEKTLRLDEAS